MKKQYILVSLLVLSLQSASFSREFLNTVVHLNFGWMNSFATTGDVIDSERNTAKSLIPNSTQVSHYETAWCGTLDIVPTDPIILGMEDHAVKFGLRGSYRFHFLQQRVTADIEVGDKVLDYQSWMVGPVIHYAPYVEPSDLNEDYTATGGFTFYALYGRINGDLTAYPAVREKIGYNGEYSTKAKGYKFDIGAGAEIALCSLNVGVNIYYTYIDFDMNTMVYPGSGENGKLREGCLELYVGIPIEQFIEPIIPVL